MTNQHDAAVRRNSFKVGVRTKHNPELVYNGLRFNTSVEADLYAEQLKRRWPDVTASLVLPSPDMPNCTFPVPNDRFPVKRGE